jgi:hypothetical protein
MSKILPMTPELEVTLRGALQQFSVPDASKLSHRYDESVSLVSAVDPILGFELRSKDLVGPKLQQLNALLFQDMQAAVYRWQDNLIYCVLRITTERGPKWARGR